MMNANRVWHLMCNSKKHRVYVKNRKRYVKELFRTKLGECRVKPQITEKSIRKAFRMLERVL